jgi:protein tyrosine phosphatase (PTP) superfamily phosphohydrolase (DUF442 family)
MNRTPVFGRTLMVWLLAGGVACAPGGGGTEESTRTAAEQEGSPSKSSGVGAGHAIPADVAALRIRNARMPSPGLLTGGQLTSDQMLTLRDLGYRHFISLRERGEEGAGWEEEFAESEGIAFTRIPVAGADGIARENAERLDARLARAGTEPTVLYCGSGNRVGALIAVRAHLIGGTGAEEALALGKAAGLTRLEPKVRELLSLDSE